MRRMVIVAEMSLREVSRRRGVLVLTVTLPLWFYLARRDLTGQSIRMLALGVGWAVATVMLFTTSAARQVDHRLRLAGYSIGSLLGGRMLAMTGGGLVIALAYWGLVAALQDVARLWVIGPMMALTVLVAAPCGALLAMLLPRELEGALALLTVVALQMLTDPEGTVARLLPFWSARELATYAVDSAGTSYLIDGLIHAAGAWTLFTAGAWAISAFRLRLAHYPPPPAPS